MSMCSVFSCVVGRGCLLWPVNSHGKTLLAFDLLHFVLEGQICWLIQVFLNFLFLHSNPLVPMEELKGIVVYISWGWTRTLPWGCTIVFLTASPYFSLSPLPLSWQVSVWICPLEMKEGQEGWCCLFSTSKKQGTGKGFILGGPHRVVLSFSTLRRTSELKDN